MVDLVFRWRVIQEQLSSRQSFCWSGGWQWRTVRGAGYARTPNYVRRSSIPSRRPCLARASMLACMLVLSTPRSTSSILSQRTYGAANTMTLSVLRLLRWARCMYRRQGLRSLVLGPGSIVSSLVDVHPHPACTPTCWHDQDTVAWTGYCSFQPSWKSDHISLLAPFATATRHCSRSFGASSTAPRLPSNDRQDR